ncbi:MAG: S1C family serine protease, partial [Gemmatimonas sp.]
TVELKDGRKFDGSVYGIDTLTDLAIVKVNQTGLPTAPLGESDNLKIGQLVVAIGSPLGTYSFSVTSGIVSGKGRDVQVDNGTRITNLIQTDAAINPGNSGGALVDAAGNLIGINSTIFSQSGGSLGIGFAIPVSLARNVLEQIIRDGVVTRGWLGIEPQEVTAEVAQALALDKPGGVVIRGLVRDGPAARAGVQLRDVVTEIDGKPTRDVPSLLARIAELPPGAPARVKILRDGRPVDGDVTVGKRPAPE